MIWSICVAFSPASISVPSIFHAAPKHITRSAATEKKTAEEERRRRWWRKGKPFPYNKSCRQASERASALPPPQRARQRCDRGVICGGGISRRSCVHCNICWWGSSFIWAYLIWYAGSEAVTHFYALCIFMIIVLSSPVYGFYDSKWFSRSVGHYFMSRFFLLKTVSSSTF